MASIGPSLASIYGKSLKLDRAAAIEDLKQAVVGLQGDRVSEELVGELPGHLEDGAFATIVRPPVAGRYRISVAGGSPGRDSSQDRGSSHGRGWSAARGRSAFSRRTGA